MKNMTYICTKLFLVLSVFIVSVSHADVLELKDGTVLNGTYESGTKGTIRFKVKGELKVIPVKDIISLSFTGGSTSSAPSSPSTVTATAVTKTPTKSAEPKKVPSGTVLLVRTSEEIGTHNMKEGARFTTKLESKLMSGKVMVVPQGATVYGRVIKSKKGGMGRKKAILELTLTEIMIDGQLRKITTSHLVGEGESGGIGRKMVKAAAIGGLVDGSKGAETGAKVGAGIGIIGGGKNAGIKANTVIEFTLSAELKV